MSEYTPSLDEARDRYADARAGVGVWTRLDEAVRRAIEDAYAEFDRWLADHDAKVRADERERCAQIAESSTRPLPGHGGFEAGSRSQWYANGVHDAAARIRGEQA